jgi:hypothetical protein
MNKNLSSLDKLEALVRCKNSYDERVSELKSRKNKLDKEFKGEVYTSPLPSTEIS